MTNDRINRRYQTAGGLNACFYFPLPSSFFWNNSVGKTAGCIFAYRFPWVSKGKTGKRLWFLLGTEGLVEKRACQSSEPASKDQNCVDFCGVSKVKKELYSDTVADF